MDIGGNASSKWNLPEHDLGGGLGVQDTERLDVCYFHNKYTVSFVFCVPFHKNGVCQS